MIRGLIIIGIFLTTLLSEEYQSKTDTPPTVVDKVNINKYCGLWYEIARIPNSFQSRCAREVTARYELRNDGRLNVTNKCIKENGKINKIKGIAKIVDNNTNAKLKVSFVRIFGFNLFWGDYWIIGLDESYEYAVIGGPERKYGWILSRKPALKDRTIQEIFKLLKNKGYDPERFVMTEQNMGLTK